MDARRDPGSVHRQSVLSWKRGRVADQNPWEATTLEWQTTSPPAEHNFDETPAVARGPYEYSVPGEATDFSPQHVVRSTSHVAHPSVSAARSTSHVARPDTGVDNTTLGMWLFIASEVMLFGGLFSAYVLLRNGAATWAVEGESLSFAKGLALSAPLLLATVALRQRRPAGLGLAGVLGMTFLLLKGEGYWAMAQAGLLPSDSTFLALYYLVTGVHAVHALIGVLVSAYLAIRGSSSTDGDKARFENRVRAVTIYWYFVDIVWICVFTAFYLL